MLVKNNKSLTFSLSKTLSLLLLGITIGIILPNIVKAKDELNLNEEYLSIRNDLDKILEINSFDEEMIDYIEQKHIIQKSSTSKQSLVLIRISNLLASIGHLKFAIKSKFVDTIKGKILPSYEDSDEDDDLIKVKLIISRAWLRCKVTIMLHTSLLWKRLYKLFEHYNNNNNSNNNDNKHFFESISESRLLKDSFKLDSELKIQKRNLLKYREFIMNESNDLNDKINDLELLDKIDKLIDEAFNCQDCSSLSSSIADNNNNLNWMKTNALPLVPLDDLNDTISKKWLVNYVDKKYLEMVENSENNELENKLFVDPQEWFSVSMEDIEKFRLKLKLGDRAQDNSDDNDEWEELEYFI